MGGLCLWSRVPSGQGARCLVPCPFEGGVCLGGLPNRYHPRQRPLRQRPPWTETPPQERDSLDSDPLLDRYPPSLHPCMIKSRRYASYWLTPVWEILDPQQPSLKKVQQENFKKTHSSGRNDYVNLH